MGDARETLAFLTRSATRVAVLRALAGGAQDRRTLVDVTESSRSTLSRALASLEEEGWIRRTDGTYSLTRGGSLIIERLVPLLEAIEGVETLGDGLSDLPIEEMRLDVRQLADATVVQPTELEPTAPYDHGIARLRAADRFWCVARTAPQLYVTAFHEAVMEREIDARCVLAGTYLDRLPADGDLRAKWEAVASTGVSVQRTEASIPYIVHVIDERVHIWLCGADGDTWGVLESENPTVCAWAEDLIMEYAADAQPLEPDAGV